MTDRDYLVENLSVDAVCTQLAEECAELAKAALKLCRSRSDENPTPVSEAEILEKLTEELADVYCCIDIAISALGLSAFEVISISNFKKTRWAERLRSARKNKGV